MKILKLAIKLDNNNIITGTYNYLPPANNKFSLIGAFDSKKGQILGNWAYGSITTNGGLGEMTK